MAIACVAAAPAFAAAYRCCDANDDGAIETPDALLALQTAVGSKKKCAAARCDCNNNGSITAGDAIDILRIAVGASAKDKCPPEDTPTTTTSSSSTTLPAGSCGDYVVDDVEDCDPPFGFCRGGCNPYTNLCVDMMCSESCTCPPPRCGDHVIDPGESCDPPGSPCETGTCTDSCGCD